MRRKVKLFTLIVLVALMAVYGSGCFFLDFLFGSEEEPKEPTPEEEEIEREEEKEPLNDEDERETTFYLLENDSGKLVRTESNIPWVEGIAQETLTKMVRDDENLDYWGNYHLEPVIPSGTEVKGMTIDDDGSARVNFTEEFMDYQGDKAQMIDSVVYTLTEFEAIDGVEFMIDGEPLSELPESIDAITANDVIDRMGINAEVPVVADDGVPITLYYISEKDGNTFYVPITRMVSETDEIEGEALAELIRGPDEDSNLESFVSPEIQLNEIDFDNESLTIDVSNITTEEGREEEAAKQIIYTLGEFDMVQSVELTIDGEKTDFL